jgi:hypothetical protein
MLDDLARASQCLVVCSSIAPSERPGCEEPVFPSAGVRGPDGLNFGSGLADIPWITRGSAVRIGPRGVISNRKSCKGCKQAVGPPL